MKKVLALALVSTIALSGAQSADAANPKSGAACTKVNQKVDFADKTFTCVKKGSKLVWNAGVASAKPAANKGASEGFLCTEGSAQQRVQTEQLCIALKAPMEKVHGDHKHNKAVVVDLELAEAEAVEEAAEEAVAAVAAEEAETTKTLHLN
jgi:opacity protein-like surface antigen